MTHPDEVDATAAVELSAAAAAEVQLVAKPLDAAGPWTTRLPGQFTTALVVAAVGAVAAATRLPSLSNAPPGFLIDEASAALYAQSINRQHLPLFFGSGSIDVQEPFFFYLMKWTGTLFGWDVVGARLAAALCGIVVALACALWYRRALGPIWGLAGGLLVATSFWQLMFSRQATRPISVAIFAAGGLWLLWEALALPPDVSRRRLLLYYGAAGAAFGLGFYSYIAFRLIVVAVPAVGGLLLWQRRRKRTEDGPLENESARTGTSLTVDPRGLALGLLVMLAVMTPLSIYYARHPGDFTRRMEQVRDEEGGARVIANPLSMAKGYGETLRSFVWDGYESPNVNQPGRPILDPLLAGWAIAGLAIALRHPLRPLHGVALLWFAIFILPSALSSPGHPERELAATPAVYLFPLLAMAAAIGWALRRNRTTTAVCGALVALTLVGSAAWSLNDYFRVWAPSQAAYVAFEGDVRDSLEAIDALPPDGQPVYYSTWSLERLVTYLAPARPHRNLDGRTTLATPEDGGGYLVYPTVTTPDPTLLALFGGVPPIAAGQTPDGSVAWQTLRVDARLRDRLPYVVPPVGLADGFTIIGFEVAPIRDGNPQPRVAVTLVWRLGAGGPAALARLRLVAVGEPLAPVPSTQVDFPVAPSSTNVLGTLPGELLITRVVLDFPVSADMLADVQVALLGADGAPLPPLDAAAGASDNYAQLNRIQYQLVTP